MVGEYLLGGGKQGMRDCGVDGGRVGGEGWEGVVGGRGGGLIFWRG